jgi:NADH:ubiquinone oxidoreductase subunit 5 (subunit L)/multisubunit Na+/H+ antiporter MnhA subunit
VDSSIPLLTIKRRLVAGARGSVLDLLSGMMILIVTGIGTLIHVYSTASYDERGGVARYSAT